MERLHPNLSFAATCALIALALGISGCRSSSSGIAGSPFMSPDRVPPPNTRAIQPGQAQPYYQGDPLPAMQTAAPRPEPAVAAVPSEVETRTASGRTLAWTQPGTGAPAPTGAATAANVAPATATPPAAPQQPQAMVVASENSVAVPNDADPLRFPLPIPTIPEPAAPIASAVPIQTPTQPQAVQPAPLQQVAGVQQASYNAPIPSAPLLSPAAPGATTPPPLAKPWRSPQIVQATQQPPSYAPQPVAGQQYAAAPQLPAPPPVPANTMAATIRAVDSPTQTGDPIPRVRVPGYIASQTSADGFRARTSMQ